MHLFVHSTQLESARLTFRQGDQFYHTFGLEFQNRWRDLGIFAAFIGSNLIILFIGSRYLNFNRR